MKNREKINLPESGSKRTLIVIGAIFVVLGLGASYFFSQSIEGFFWEARTKAVIQKVDELGKQIRETDIAQWQDNDAHERLDAFEKGIEKNISNIKAVKIYTLDGTLAFTDLKNIEQGVKEADVAGEIQELKKFGHIIKSAGVNTKQELGKTDLLEVWTIIKGSTGEDIWYVEFYFDSSDIVAFISKIKYSIWGTITLVLGIVITLLFIVFRKQNDLVIRQARELSNIIEHSPVGIYTIDTKGIVISINKKMLELIGENDPKNILGYNIFDIKRIHRMDIAKAIREALLGIPFDKETSGIDDNGKEIHRHYRGTPLFIDENGTVGQVLFVVEDTTEHKKLEKEISLRTEDLEKRVDERTKELQDKIADLEQFERVTVGREIRMTELKQEMEQMRIKLESLGVKPDEPWS
ncbi:MAG: PAS domain S-box protein [Candidatus Yonathbacteria bacterium]|nr:PAS domain S-box protein [Candidatus Yonathbacteria bacterium]